ncbi:hypothetical protein JXQ31_02565 [candidate division KSB1 bacterium]|nr:hypothetical protein [candidate division KSB1 bacterium]
MLTLEKAIIKKYWPAEDKVDEEIVRQLVIQAEAELDNSMQVGEIYNHMVRGLIKVSLLDSLTGEEYVLPPATIKPFNVKQKKVKTGKGMDAEIVKTEFAALTLVCRLKENKASQILADLYNFFNIQIQLTMAELQLQETVDINPVSDEEE